MAFTGGLGLLAASILVARSYVQSAFWSKVVLCLGILVVAVGAVVFLGLMQG
jgi:hypothetical protein